MVTLLLLTKKDTLSDAFSHTLKNKYYNPLTCFSVLYFFRSNPRTVSIGHLHVLLHLQLQPIYLIDVLLHLQLQPIYLIVSKGSYSFRMGNLILWSALQLQPIYLIVSKGSYSFRMGNLILWSASRLDAFSVYQIRTWLLCYAFGKTTDAPVVRPSRSSRTKDSSTQISCAHDG